MGGRDTESQVERRFRPLSKRQRHRESGEKTVQATTWEAETQRVRWKTVEATTWEAETQRVR